MYIVYAVCRKVKCCLYHIFDVKLSKAMAEIFKSTLE